MTTTLARGRRWIDRGHDAAGAARLAERLRLPLPLGALLAARGFAEVEAARAHLEAPLAALADPFLLPDLERAAQRFVRAVREREPILVHGDYDVDGVSGTALLVRLAQRLGGDVHWHIPNRLVDGYSFGAHSLARARACGARLLISVDNGTSAHETIAEFAAAGVDVIVTDHHEPPPDGVLPAAYAIVNPKLAASRYPFRDLCGAAVAFKFAWGVAQIFEGTTRVSASLKDFLVEAMAYVAIATVCDVVPLVDENRVLARAGLKSLAATRHEGLSALLAAGGIGGRALGGEDVAFKIGPRLNAAGRLGSAERALEVLLCDDAPRARALVRELEALNEERRRIERAVLDQARRAVREQTDAQRDPVLVVGGEGWHQGVVGIVAARLVEEFGKPALVIGFDGASGRGSARSIPGFDVLAAMHGASAHFLRHGGHAQAAGCELRADALAAARRAICTRGTELLGASAARVQARELTIDAAVDFGALTPEFMGELARLEPFGQGNEAPVFRSADLRLAEPPRRIGADRAHLAIRLRRGAHALRALAFGQGERERELVMGAPLEACFTPRWNTWQGRTDLELLLHDFRVGATASDYHGRSGGEVPRTDRTLEGTTTGRGEAR